MRQKTRWLMFALFFLGAVVSWANEGKLEVWKAPKGVSLNDNFTVKVRHSGGAWKNLPSYLIKVDKVEGVRHVPLPSSMATFGFEGKVEVSVTYNKGEIRKACVRPASRGIETVVEGNTLTFTLDKPGNFSVEVNGDIFNNLHLFANPIETDVPDKKDKDVIWYGPGIHRPDSGEVFRIPSGKTVYVAGGAVMMGQLLMDSVENVRLLGRGIVDHTVKMGIRISNSKNIYVEGLFATQCATGGSEHVTIRNVKSISYYGWGDGMNIFASRHVLFDNVFCRNSDDCTTVYGTRLGFTGASSDITMRHSVLWADVAHPIFIGIHGDTKNPEVLENLTYEDIDILDHKECQLNYQGCMAINAGDNNLIRNVRFENIRIENFRQGQLVNLRIFYNEKYCTAPGRGIEDVLFKDITYTGDHAEISIIEGYNEERKIKNIRFKNLKINGTVISDDMPGKPKWYHTGDMARIYVGPHVEGVVFER